MFFGHYVILFCFIANLYFIGSSADDGNCPICKDELERKPETEHLFTCSHGIHKECAKNSSKEENYCYICKEVQAPAAPSGQTHSGGGAPTNPSQTHQTRAGRTHQPSSSGHSSNPSANRGHSPQNYLDQEELDRRIAEDLSYYDDNDPMGPMTTANDAQIAEDLQKKLQLEDDAEFARRLAAER
ncbi:hypothetical protein niasHT_002801 [Heterodera trifolii]|uniref:RING-type domain-containing protein n=1 Tax=Heterodera trifolii TaxID=157864 RepID=A0ABD2M881_9BILA